MTHKIMLMLNMPGGGYKELETGYYSDDLDTAIDLRNALLRRNPEMNFVIYESSENG